MDGELGLSEDVCIQTDPARFLASLTSRFIAIALIEQISDYSCGMVIDCGLDTCLDSPKFTGLACCT